LAIEGDLPVNGRSANDPRNLRPSAGALTDAKRKAEIQTGADAVALSKQQVAQQSVVTVTSENEQVYFNQKIAQQVGVKTFYQANNLWQDAEFKPEANLPEIKVQFASDEYFTLVNQEKELAQFFALGEQVIVVYKGKVYRVTK
jgi:hypothetical protein